MQCPKCLHDNPASATILHALPHAVCASPVLPAGTFKTTAENASECGVDFAKYAAMLLFQAREKAQGTRKRAGKFAIAKQILLIPITGGLSLVKYVLSRFREE